MRCQLSVFAWSHLVSSSHGRLPCGWLSWRLSRRPPKSYIHTKKIYHSVLRVLLLKLKFSEVVWSKSQKIFTYIKWSNNLLSEYSVPVPQCVYCSPLAVNNGTLRGLKFRGWNAMTRDVGSIDHRNNGSQVTENDLHITHYQTLLLIISYHLSQ